MQIIKQFFIILPAFVLILGIQTISAFGESKSGIPVTTETGNQSAPVDVLARVNGSSITQSQVDRVIRIFIAQSRVSHDIATETRKQAEDAALEQLIATQLLYQAGLTRGIRDLDKQIADKINQEKAKFPTPAAYDAALKTNGFTEQDAQQVVRNGIVVNNLVDKEIISKIAVSNSESKSFFDQNQDKFTKPENVRLSHILIGVDPQATPEEKQIVALKAKSIRNKILAGADFVAMAKAESSCPSKEEGGDLGFFDKGEMIPEFEKAVSLLKSGQVSQVVETQDGYHILRLVEMNGATIIPFDEVTEKIENHLKQFKTQQAIRDFVADLRKTAKIEFVLTRGLASSAHY